MNVKKWGPSGSILVDNQIYDLIEKGHVKTGENQIQPASIDLLFTGNAYAVNFLPPHGGGDTPGFNLNYFKKYAGLSVVNLKDGSLPTTKGQTYLVGLNAEFSLPKGIGMYINPKSTAGRINAHGQIIAQGEEEFDITRPGYKGEVYALISPDSFPFILHEGDSLLQARFYIDRLEYVSIQKTKALQQKRPFVFSEDEVCFDEDGVVLHLDLEGYPSNLTAKRVLRPIDLQDRRSIDPTIYFYEKHLHNGQLILDPDTLTLCRSREVFEVPEGYCAEMDAISSRRGLMLTHRAGFFDPGFKEKAVLELFNLINQPTSLGSGQKICTMRLQRLAAKPTNRYGNTAASEASNYINNELLAKFFEPWTNFTLSHLQKMRGKTDARQACLRLNEKQAQLTRIFMDQDTQNLENLLVEMLDDYLGIANEYNLNLETLLKERK